MASTEREHPLSVHLERLRMVLERLAFVHEGSRYEELLEQARLAASNVRSARAALAAGSARKGRHAENTPRSAPRRRRRSAAALAD